MAKTKADWFAEAQEAGHLDADADADDYTIDQLKEMLGEDEKAGSDGESSSVADTIANAPGIDAGNIVSSPVVQSTTEEVPREGDETSMPNVLETEPAAPVSTQEPDEPIAQTLAAGAGEHTPPDPEKFDSEGRLRDPNA